MADTDLTTGYGTQPVGAQVPVIKWERIVDFSANNLGSSDTMQLFDLPADVLVMLVTVEVLTAEGGTATIDIGITGGDVDKYMDGANINQSAGTVIVSGDAGTAEPVAFENNGAYLSSAETVSVLANNALDAAKIRVQIFAFDCRGTLSSS